MPLNDQADRCTATTRDGDRCKNPAVTGSTTCRMHGGTAEGGGAPEGNKNAVTTGEHEAITYGQLTESERALWHEVDTSFLPQLEGQIRLLAIRVRRMLERIQLLKGEGMVLAGREEKEGRALRAHVHVTFDTKRHEIEAIQDIEADLTRAQSEMRKLLREKYRILKDRPTDNSEKLDLLLDRMASMRDDTQDYEP